MFGSLFKGSGNGLDMVFRVGTIGIHLAVCTFAGVAIGYYLDKYFETSPWLLFIFFVLGIAAGFKNLYTETKRILNAQANDGVGKDGSGKDGSDDREDKPKT